MRASRTGGHRAGTSLLLRLKGLTGTGLRTLGEIFPLQSDPTPPPTNGVPWCALAEGVAPNWVHQRVFWSMSSGLGEKYRACNLDFWGVSESYRLCGCKEISSRGLLLTKMHPSADDSSKKMSPKKQEKNVVKAETLQPSDFLEAQPKLLIAGQAPDIVSQYFPSLSTISDSYQFSGNNTHPFVSFRCHHASPRLEPFSSHQQEPFCIVCQNHFARREREGGHQGGVTQGRFPSTVSVSVSISRAKRRGYAFDRQYSCFLGTFLIDAQLRFLSGEAQLRVNRRHCHIFVNHQVQTATHKGRQHRAQSSGAKWDNSGFKGRAIGL